MSNSVFPNKVIESKIEDMYNTKVAMNDFITINNALTRAAGDTLTVKIYKATGNVQDLSMGNGNTSSIESEYYTRDYTVGVTQGRSAYYDEEFNKDPMIVDVLLEGQAAKMANDNASKIINQLKLSHNWSIATAYNFDSFADAVAVFNMEAEEKLYAFINPADLAKLRKGLNADLKYVEAFARRGYVGTVCGVDVITNKAVSEGEIEIFTREAVTLFNKRGFEVEQERIPNTRQNLLYNRKTCVVALTNESKAVRFFAGLSDFITTSADVSTTASTTAGSTVLHVFAAPAGYKWVYKAGSSAATPTFGTAYTTGVTAITDLDTTIAMSTNTHLTVVLVNSSDSKPVAYKDLTGDDLHIGA